MRYLLNLIVGRIGENSETLESLHDIVSHRLNSIHTDTFAVDHTSSLLTNIALVAERAEKSTKKGHMAEYMVETG
jgi:hypothetical protein